MSPDLATWLGDTDLTDDQAERLTHEAGAIADRYPDPDDAYRRDAAMSAALQYILGDITPDRAGRALDAARTAELVASAAAQQLAVMAVADGTSEVEAARRTRLDRMTVRKALGK